MSPSFSNLRPDQDPRFDRALNLASRFMALVRSGRAYSLDHVALTQQMEHYLALLAPVLAEQGRACFDAPEGDLCLNGDRLPFRQNMHRAIEQLVQEFGARSLAGIEFLPGLALPEFRSFMGLFLPGERWKGQDLIVACQDAGITRLRALPLRSAAVDRGAVAAADALSAALGPVREAWAAFLAGTQQLLSGNALDHGVELRHVKRLAQPLVESVLAGERSVAALAGVAPGEPTWAHAAHTALVAVSIASRLELGRRDAIDIAVAALLHDVGHGWPESAATTPGAAGPPARPPARGSAPHTSEGVRRIAWATTLNRNSLDAMRTALEHHDLVGPASPSPARLSRLVATADAYVTFLSRGTSSGEWVSPSGALARVLDQLHAGAEPALGAALVRALGFYPPGQLVELDNGTLARAIVPVAEDPERPWVQPVTDERGALLSAKRLEAIPLPDGRRIARALPREEWPVDVAARRVA